MHLPIEFLLLVYFFHCFIFFQFPWIYSRHTTLVLLQYLLYWFLILFKPYIDFPWWVLLKSQMSFYSLLGIPIAIGSSSSQHRVMYLTILPLRPTHFHSPVMLYWLPRGALTSPSYTLHFNTYMFRKPHIVITTLTIYWVEVFIFSHHVPSYSDGTW